MDPVPAAADETTIDAMFSIVLWAGGCGFVAGVITTLCVLWVVGVFNS